MAGQGPPYEPRHDAGEAAIRNLLLFGGKADSGFCAARSPGM